MVRVFVPENEGTTEYIWSNIMEEQEQYFHWIIFYKHYILCKLLPGNIFKMDSDLMRACAFRLCGNLQNWFLGASLGLYWHMWNVRWGWHHQSRLETERQVWLQGLCNFLTEGQRCHNESRFCLTKSWSFFQQTVVSLNN